MKTVKHALFCVLKFFVRVFYRRPHIDGVDNLPTEPCILVGNHTQMNGPLVAELYLPGKQYIWCAGEMMHLKEVPAYAYRDFWSRKPRHTRWFYKLLSYLIAPLAALVFTEAHTIAVYHDRRGASTFRDTVKRLQEGANIVIFPEHDVPYNHIVCDFQEGFVDTARLYYKRTGKVLSFVPMYLAPALHRVCIGRPRLFHPEAPVAEERKRLCHDLMEDITAMAASLPRHRVVPYNNVPRKQYGYSKEETL